MYLAPLGVAYICRLAIVANITGEVLVEVVHLNMNAISVSKIIRSVSVIFVPQDPSILYYIISKPRKTNSSQNK